MSFVSTIFLWGIAAATVPLALHLLARRRRVHVSWGAMQFLFADVRTKRRSTALKIADLLPLFLRMLAIAVLALAFSRPLFSRESGQNTVPEDVVLVIDNSLSTSAGDLIEEQTRREIGKLGPGDSVHLLVTCPTPTWLTPRPGDPEGTTKPGQALDLLAGIAASSAATDFPACFAEALASPPETVPRPRAVTVISDGFAHGWHPDEPGRWRSVSEAAGTIPGVRVRVVAPGAGFSGGNLSVTSVTPAEPLVAVGDTVRVSATVTNTSPEKMVPVAVRWEFDGSLVRPDRTPALAPGASATFELDIEPKETGFHQVLFATGGGDVLTGDDTASAVIEATAGIPVLYLTPEPTSSYDAENLSFFLAALGGGGWQSIFQADVEPVGALGSLGDKLASYAVVVLGDLPRVTPEQVGILEEFADGGGGVWFTFGENTDVAFYNRTLHGSGDGFLPVPLVAGPEMEAGGVLQLMVPTPPHPSVALIADPEHSDLSGARLTRSFSFGEPLPDRVARILQFENSPGAYAVTYRHGAGRVLAQAGPLGARWGNVPALAVYLPMVNEWLRYLSEPRTVIRNLSAGRPLIAVGPAGETTATVTPPSGVPVVVEAAESAGRSRVVFTETAEPGSYRIRFGNGTRDEEFVVERDADESELTPLTKEDAAVIQGFTGAVFEGFGFGGDVPETVSDQLEDIPLTQNDPVWGSFFLLLLALLLAESCVVGASKILRIRRAPGVQIN